MGGTGGAGVVFEFAQDLPAVAAGVGTDVHAFDLGDQVGVGQVPAQPDTAAGHRRVAAVADQEQPVGGGEVGGPAVSRPVAGPP